MAKGEDLLTARLQKNKKEAAYPKNVFSRNELPTSNNEEVKKLNKNRSKEKTTTIRCHFDASYSLKAIVDVLGLDNIADLIDDMVDHKLVELTPEQKAEYKALRKIYDKKKK